MKPQSFYTLQGVRLPDGAYGNVQVTEKLLDHGKSRTQREWQDYRKETGWGPGSAPLITAVLTALYDNKGAEGVEELRGLFSDDFKKQLMMTATGVTSRTRASDIVTHDSGTPEQRTLEARLAGPDGYIHESVGGEMQALLGSADISRVSDVYKWVTGRKSYLWRLSKQPKRDKQGALVLGDGSIDGGFYILAVDYGVIIDGRPARGVRVAPQNSTGSKG